MINDFTFLYGNNKKVSDALGETNAEMLLKNSKRVFGGREQVFFEYAREETHPIYNGRQGPEPKENFVRRGIVVDRNNSSPSGATVMAMDIDTSKHGYDVKYNHQYCMPVILNSLEQFETKKFFSVDLEYILSISRAFTDYDFSHFDGEGLRILKAWLFVMSYGVRHSEDPSIIMIHSSKNEYGEKARTRSVVRNSFYNNEAPLTDIGAPYAESTDSEWALSGDDYSKVQALNVLMTELSKGTPLLYNYTIMPDMVNNTRQYGATTPEYLLSILDMRKLVNENNNKGY
jgi:hypothetical protein